MHIILYVNEKSNSWVAAQPPIDQYIPSLPADTVEADHFMNDFRGETLWRDASSVKWYFPPHFSFFPEYLWHCYQNFIWVQLRYKRIQSEQIAPMFSACLIYSISKLLVAKICKNSENSKLFVHRSWAH